MQSNKTDWLSELKDKIDIVSVVADYVPLKQKGMNFWGCCPFHHEKTPSFSVNSNSGFYHCFGCKESGDAIKFVEKVERVSFLEACKILAEKVGYEIPTYSMSDESIASNKKNKDKSLQIAKETAKFYYKNLAKPEAKPYNDYMDNRGMSKTVQTVFGMGASLDYHSLPNYLVSLGYSNEEMLLSGVCQTKDNERIYDALGKRLIYPIIDSYGNVVGFGGRELEKTDFAKYKNTQSTIIFDKSKILYGLNLIKKLKLQEKVDHLIMVEGYMDTISLYSSGFKNVVASMGTALTTNQIRLLKNYVDKVIVSYDGDTAGQLATLRSLDELKKQGLQVYVAVMPQGLDPDDVIKKQGVDNYQKLLDNALTLNDYKIKITKEKYNLNDKEERREYADECLKHISKMDSELEREEYMLQLKKETGYTINALKSQLGTTESPLKKTNNESNADNAKTSGRDKAIRFILLKMLENKEFAYNNEDISSFIQDNLNRRIYDYALNNKGSDNKINNYESVYTHFGDDGKKELDLIFKVESDFNGLSEEIYFKDCVNLFKRLSLELQIELLSASFEGDLNAEEKKDLSIELAKAMDKLKNLKSNI